MYSSMIDEMPRGGKRENSGPKPNWNLGKTKVIRVPEIIADLLIEVAKKIDSGDSPENIAEFIAEFIKENLEGKV